MLKRVNGTPLPSLGLPRSPGSLHALLVSVLLVAITIGLRARLLRGRHPDRRRSRPVRWSSSWSARRRFCALGFAITAVIPNSDAAAPIVNATILPLLFLSGVFIPIGDNAPSWIIWTARIFPVKHFADGIQAGFLGTTFQLDRRARRRDLGCDRSGGGPAVVQLGATPLTAVPVPVPTAPRASRESAGEGLPR